VHTAWARALGNPRRRVFRPVEQRIREVHRKGAGKDVPSGPSFVIKSLMYGPGSPPRASKQSAVSSVTQAFPSCRQKGRWEGQAWVICGGKSSGRTCFAADLHFAMATSCVEPWTSGTVAAPSADVRSGFARKVETHHRGPGSSLGSLNRRQRGSAVLHGVCWRYQLRRLCERISFENIVKRPRTHRSSSRVSPLAPTSPHHHPRRYPSRLLL
jgi:hypothetical protein